MPNGNAAVIDRSIPQKTETEISLWMQEHTAYLRRLSLSILDDEAEAEDMVQETFITAARNLESYRQEASPRTWLTAIAVNHCRGRLRWRKVQKLLNQALQAVFPSQAPASAIEDFAIHAEAERELWKAVDALDEKHRLVVILHYVHELSTTETARVLGISEGTVHSRLHHSRKKLHDQLSNPTPGKEVTDETHPS
jgi:RNA polymerase sigma-70 factor, ECF subfamily